MLQGTLLFASPVEALFLGIIRGLETYPKRCVGLSGCAHRTYRKMRIAAHALFAPRAIQLQLQRLLTSREIVMLNVVKHLLIFCRPFTSFRVT